jgi:large subunit ribosomal protein L25
VIVEVSFAFEGALSPSPLNCPQLAGRFFKKTKTKKGQRNMSQSLHAIKRFRLRELLITRIPPAATASASNQPQRPLASTPLATQQQPQPAHLLSTTTTTTRSGGDVLAAAAIVLNNPFVPHKNPKSGRWAPPKYSLRRQADLIKHARKSGTQHLLPPGPKMMSETQLASASAAAVVPSTLSVAAAEEEQEKREEAAAATSVSGLVSSVRREPGQGRGQDSKDAPDEWTKPVEWVGTVRERSVAGADIGNRLYAGKKRMFKGHKWERERERRVARTKMLLRDMDKRVQRFKAVRFNALSSSLTFFILLVSVLLTVFSLLLSFLFQYRAKGKPLPLARRSNMLKKTQKLPF